MTAPVRNGMRNAEGSTATATQKRNLSLNMNFFLEKLACVFVGDRDAGLTLEGMRGSWHERYFWLTL